MINGIDKNEGIIESQNQILIGINATTDVNGSQDIEIKDEGGNIHLLDSFEVFFKEGAEAKKNYEKLFIEAIDELEEKNSTKLNVKNIWNNLPEIQRGQTQSFNISIEYHSEKIEKYFIGHLLENDEVQTKITEKYPEINGVLDTKKYGLSGLKLTSSRNGYKSIFSVGRGGGLHNIASTMEAFESATKLKAIKKISPKDINSKYGYTLRESLFCVINGEKICLRTDPSPEKIDELDKKIAEIIEKHKDIVTDILEAGKRNSTDRSNLSIHSVPTQFNENVFRNNDTTVFNGEHRETGKLISSVIEEIELLDLSKMPFKKTTLSESLDNLKDLQRRLHKNNKTLLMNKNDKINTQDSINQIEMEEAVEFKSDIDIKKLALKKYELEKDDILEERQSLLKEILVKLVQITEISELTQEKTNNKKQKIGMITDGENGLLGFMDIYSYKVFFTNGILQIGEKEEKLFKVLKKISKGIIDIKTKDTTGCGDSSTAAALMTREDNFKKSRKELYLKKIQKTEIEGEDYDRSMAIIEAYYLSSLQETISGVIYRCRKSNLGDISNNTKCAKVIIKYVDNKVDDFIETSLAKFLDTDNSSAPKGRGHNGFNVYKVEPLK